jgi:outer membrane lipoprotein-sorting protein
MSFKKIIYSFALIFLSAQFLGAQSNAQAEKIITDLLAEARTNAIKTNFRLITTDKSNSQSASGTFTLKGSRFVLEMETLKAWFDGKTQWSYVAQSNEVSITEPTEKELAETNPMAILSGFKSKCFIKFSTIKSATEYYIDMIPKLKDKNISKIEVQVNKSSGNLVSIKLNNKNGSSTTLKLTNFQKGLKVADNVFVFNQIKYKGVVVNDLR